MIFYDDNKLELHKLKCLTNRSFECDLCPFKLDQADMDTIKHHMQKEHTNGIALDSLAHPKPILEKFALSTQPTRIQSEAMPSQRSKCSENFPENERPQRQEKKCRTKSRFECHVCRYTYPRMKFDEFKSHMRKHTGERMHFIRFSQ